MDSAKSGIEAPSLSVAAGRRVLIGATQPRHTAAGSSVQWPSLTRGGKSAQREDTVSLNRISRRDALVVLGGVAVPRARAEEGLLRATRVDHVALAVGDID